MPNMWKMQLLCCVALLILAHASIAATLQVPASYATIAAAIEAAADGDTILIGPGTYYEDNFEVTKSITIQGSDSAGGNGAYQSNTIVRVATSGSTIAYVHDCDGAVLENITFDRNGTAGIAVLVGRNTVNEEVAQVNCTVRNCRVIGAPGTFGTNQWCALEALNAAYGVTFEGNLIEGVGGGSGIGFIFAYDVTITNNIIDGQGTSSGNGIYGIIYGPCTVSGNVITGCDWAIYQNQADFEVTDNIIYGNGTALVAARGSWDMVAHNNSIFDNGVGADTDDTDKILDAENNWWGSVNGPEDADGTNEMPENPASDVFDMVNATPIGELGNSVVMSEIDYYPWLNAAPTTPYSTSSASAVEIKDATGYVGQNVQLTAKLTIGGQPLSDATLSFSIGETLIGSATTDNVGVAIVSYTIPAGATTDDIRASFAGAVGTYLPASDTGTLTVSSGPVTSLTLTLTPSNLKAGESTTCTVTGNNGADYTNTAKYYVDRAAGGTWADNVYTSSKAGIWQVTAVCDTLTATAMLTVSHADDASSVSLTPADATINATGSQEYVVTATDAEGNTWSPAGVLSENGAGALNGNTYESVEGDAGTTVTITAEISGQTADALLHVNELAGPGAILAWDKDTQNFYLCSNPTDPQTGTLITGSGTYNTGSEDVTVVVSGGSLMSR